MDKYIRAAQSKILEVFSTHSRSFALAGGTALELYYLQHRYSKDLDFFSPAYDVGEIENLVMEFGRYIGSPINLMDELSVANRAKVRFYTVSIDGAGYPLKIDFVEDVFFKNPQIRRFNGTPVYDVTHMYAQKIFAVTGTRLDTTAMGGPAITGRNAIRDVVDLYFLSNKIQPLHQFLKTLPQAQRRGMVLWYRGYSRLDLKLGLSDLDLYEPPLDGGKVVSYLDNEIKQLIKEELS